MKKALKVLFVSITIIVGLGWILIHLYGKSVKRNLKEKEIAINQSWNEYAAIQQENIDLIERITHFLNDSTIYQKNSNRLKKPKESSLEFQKKEHDLNELVIDKLKKIDYENDNNLNPLVKKLKENDNLLNENIENYNFRVSSYNSYRRTFPNSLFARKDKSIKKEYFRIKYGIHNEDPVIQNEKIQKWIQTGDSL